MPPFNHDDYSSSPIRRSNERGDSSEMEEDERPRSLNGSESNLKDKFKCAICDFETVSQDIYRNHMVLHATKDQDSPPPTSLPMHLPTPPIGKKLCLKKIELVLTVAIFFVNLTYFNTGSSMYSVYNGPGQKNSWNQINQFYEKKIYQNPFFSNFKNGQKSIFELGKSL